ncbi:MAG TPA: CoA pyrophosphatase [Rhizomicrobium sp.]|nr:CoA pyrophosphatase [Rhizomicrobium sp.]
MTPPQSIIEQIAQGEPALLRERLLPHPPKLPLSPSRGDHDLNPGMSRLAILQPAAVLLPIIAHNEPSVLFTRRTPHLARHAGQVSFPGGRVHESDLSLVETALRETQEETGITAGFVTVTGFLDSYETGTGYAILPVVGLLSNGFELLPDPNEVAEVFEVPLEFLLDSANRERRSMEWRGRQREFYAFTYGPHYIWGATAGILVNFVDRLQAE